MNGTLIVGMAALVLIAATLYSSVGHAGASGYLAVMAVLGVAPEVMKPTALVLNIAVATIVSAKFYRAGHFTWGLFWPFAAASVPAAFVGGMLILPGQAYKVAVGVVLLYSAARMLVSTRVIADGAACSPPFSAAFVAGLLIGLLAGLIGVGGGIFLSPLLILLGWGGVRETAAVSAVFIWVNSVAGLLGHLSSIGSLPKGLPLWVAVAAVGGWLGSGYGSRRLPTLVLRQALAVVLVIASAKLIVL